MPAPDPILISYQSQSEAIWWTMIERSGGAAACNRAGNL
jgi:hypothetical protein